MNNYFRYDMYRINNSPKLYSPKEGFEKGNMFMNLYNEYKNYQPASLKPKNDQEKMLFNLQAICFAAHELNLYLDLHPEDQSMITLFNDYIKKIEELTRQYESKYGPLTTSFEMNKGFNWVEEKWPWEVDNV